MNKDTNNTLEYMDSEESVRQTAYFHEKQETLSNREKCIDGITILHSVHTAVHDNDIETLKTVLSYDNKQRAIYSSKKHNHCILDFTNCIGEIIVGESPNTDMIILLIEHITPFLRRQHEVLMRELLFMAIRKTCCLEVLNVIDQAWSKAQCLQTSSEEFLYDRLVSFYSVLFDQMDESSQGTTLKQYAESVGIQRHIDMINKYCKYSQ